MVAEALATGLPVITTTGAPWKELKEHNCGWWIDLTMENLTKTITEGLELSADELQSMGERWKALIEEKYEILK